MSEAISNNNKGSQREMGTFEKIYNLFFAPRKTFESIDRKPAWLTPMVIVVVVVLLFTIVVMPIMIPQQMEKQRAKMEEKGMSAEQIDKAMEMGEKFGRILGPISAGVGTVIYLLAISGLFLFVGNIILGGKSSFKKLLSVVCYTSLIGSLNSIILLPIILSKENMDVHFSLAAFMSSDTTETFLYQFLKNIDLFWIWQIIVAGIGIAVIYKFSTKKSITMVASLYVIYMVISLALTAIF